MSSIDERIVEMRFNNAQFEKGASTTISTLKTLESTVANAGSAVGMTTVGKAVDDVSSKFGALQVAAVTALGTIVNKAVNAGTSLLKSLTLDPIGDGFAEYETKMQSIQTILANTSRDGTKLKDVTGALDELNKYADKTIYSFSEMTKNIGLFTNAGIGIDDATAMIKGFSNEAASSGTNSAAAAGAAYQLSQAMSNGVVTLMDWKSLTNAGMGSTIMRDGLIDIASAMGQFNEDTTSAKKAADNFNGSLESKWLSADVMQTYLKIQAGELSAEQIKSIGLTDKQTEAFLDQQKIAYDAATKVRTGTALLGTLKEAVGSSWASTFDIILGDFNEATELFSGINKVVGGALGQMGEERNNMLKAWADAGGRDDLVAGVFNLLKAIGNIAKPIKEAWSAIFPGSEQSSFLVTITENFRKFTEMLILNDGQMAKLKDTFKGVFAVIHIIVTVIKTIAGAIGALIKPIVKAFTASGDGVLGVTSSISDWIVKMDKAFQKSKFVTQTAKWFAAAGKKIADAINKAKEAIGAFVAGFKGDADADEFSGKLGKMAEAGKKLREWMVKLKKDLAPVIVVIKDFGRQFVDSIKKAFSSFGEMKSTSDKAVGPLKKLAGKFKELKDIGPKISESFSEAGSTIKNIYDNVKKVGPAVETLWTGLKNMMGGIDPNLVIGGVNLGVFLLAIKGIKKIIDTFHLDAMFKVKEAFMGLMSGAQDSLKAFTMKLKAQALLTIALAILALAAALFILSKIPAGKLVMVTGVMGLLATALVQVLKQINTFNAADGGMKAIQVAAAMLILGGALLLMAVACKVFATVPWEGMAKGASALLAMVGVLVLVGKLPMDYVGILKFSQSLILLAAGMMLMALAIKLYSMMDLETVMDGILKIGIVLATLMLVMKLVSSQEKEFVKAAAAIVILSGALIVLAYGLKIFNEMDPKSLAISLLAVAFALAAMVIAVNLVGKDGLQNAAVIAILAGAILVIAIALRVIGELPIAAIVVGLAAVAIALAMLIGVGAILGMQPQIALGLQIFAVSLALLGAACALAGIGMLAAAAGLKIMFDLFSQAPAKIMVVIKNMFTFLPMVAAALVNFLVQLLKSLQMALPQIMTSVISIITTVLDSLVVVFPKIVDTLMFLIATLVTAIVDYTVTMVPYLSNAGMDLMLGLLHGFEDRIDEIVEVVTDIITTFIDALTDNIPDIIESGVVFIETFLQGIEDANDRLVTAFTDVIVGFIETVSDNLDRIIDAGTDLIANFIDGVAEDSTIITTAVTDLIVTMIDDLAADNDRIITAGTDLIIDFIEGIGDASLDIVTAAGETLLTFLHGVEDWIRDNGDDLNDAGWDIADAIADGMVDGVTGAVDRVGEAAGNMAQGAVDWARNTLNINSPSKVFISIGKSVGEGFAMGIKAGATSAEMEDAWDSLGEGLKGFIADTNEDIKDHLANIKELGKEQVQIAKDITDENKVLAAAQKDREKALKIKDPKKRAAALKSADAAIKKSKDRLVDLTQAQRDNTAETKKEEKAVKSLREERDKAVHTYKYMNKYLDDEKKRLKNLAGEYNRVTKQLAKANEKLKQAKATRDDYRKSTKDNYDDFSTVEIGDEENKGTTLQEFLAENRKRVDTLKTFHAKLKKLADMGLNDDLYKQLLEQGPENIPFLDELIKGGTQAINEVNSLDYRLDKVAGWLGTSGATELYQAGVDAAQGIVDGLKSKQAELKETMETLASYIVNTIKEELKIKSPSRVLMEVGKYTATGLAEGIADNAKLVEKASSDLGEGSVSALEEAMRSLGTAVPDLVDLQPTITPVLDLSKVTSSAAGMGGLFGKQSLAVGASSASASSVLAAYKAQLDGDSVAAEFGRPGGFTYIQHNTSPKALNESEIYRQTKNQLSKVKGALTT